MAQTIKVAHRRERVFEFQIKRGASFLDLSAYNSVRVVVDDANGLTVYDADCPPKDGDPTSRIVTVGGLATVNLGTFNACIHWTDGAGIDDAEPFQLQVYGHANYAAVGTESRSLVAQASGVVEDEWTQA